MTGQPPPPHPPPGAQPVPPPRPVPRAPREAWQRPARIEPVPGSPYGLLIFGQPRTVAGPAVGALVAGVGALLVALVVGCFGIAGAAAGWGLWVAGAFAVLAGFLGTAGVALGIAGLRRTRPRIRRGVPVPGAQFPPGAPSAPSPLRPPGTLAPAGGRGLAIAGLACGATGLVLIAGSLGVTLLLTLGG